MTEDGKKALLQKLKSSGEAQLMLSVDQVYELADIYVKDTANPFDDTALAFLQSLKGSLKEIVDQLDGEDDHQA